MAVQRFAQAVAGYERALALSPGHEEATSELGEARAAAVMQAAREAAVAAAATQAVAAARQHALRHGLPAAAAGGAGGGAVANGGAPHGVTRPRGDAARPRDHRRGLWGGALEGEGGSEDEAPPAQHARTRA